MTITLAFVSGQVKIVVEGRGEPGRAYVSEGFTRAFGIASVVAGVSARAGVEARLDPPPHCLFQTPTLIMDAGNLGYGWVFNYFEWGIDGAAQPYNWFNQGFFHPGGRSNMLYMDGHVAGVQHYFRTG